MDTYREDSRSITCTYLSKVLSAIQSVEDIYCLREKTPCFRWLTSRKKERILSVNESKCEFLARKLFNFGGSLQQRNLDLVSRGEIVRPFLHHVFRVAMEAESLIKRYLQGESFLEAVQLLTYDEAFMEIWMELELLTQIIEHRVLHVKENQEFLQLFDKIQMSFWEQRTEIDHAWEEVKDKDRSTLVSILHSDMKIVYEPAGASAKREFFKDRCHHQPEALYIVHTLDRWTSKRTILTAILTNKFLVQDQNPYLVVVDAKDDIKITGLLEEGASGLVMKVDWLGKINCAMKVISGGMLDSREKTILKQLKHPHIVQVICPVLYISRTDSKLALMMEIVEGGNLEDLVSKHSRQNDGGAPFELHVAIDIMLQIARAMCYVHRKGIAHRDLKCSSVLVVAERCSDGYVYVKLTDFGSAKGDVEGSTFSEQTDNVGTTRYRAPELFVQAKKSEEGGGQEVKNNPFSADVYSFAMTFAHVLTGEPPFKESKVRDAFARITAMGERPKLPISCPPLLANLLQKCWSTTPQERPSFMFIFTVLESLYMHNTSSPVPPRLTMLNKHGTNQLVGSQCDTTGLVTSPNHQQKDGTPFPALCERDKRPHTFDRHPPSLKFTNNDMEESRIKGVSNSERTIFDATPSPNTTLSTSNKAVDILNLGISTPASSHQYISSSTVRTSSYDSHIVRTSTKSKMPPLNARDLAGKTFKLFTEISSMDLEFYSKQIVLLQAQLLEAMVWLMIKKVDNKKNDHYGQTLTSKWWHYPILVVEVRSILGKIERLFSEFPFNHERVNSQWVTSAYIFSNQALVLRSLCKDLEWCRIIASVAENLRTNVINILLDEEEEELNLAIFKYNDFSFQEGPAWYKAQHDDEEDILNTLTEVFVGQDGNNASTSRDFFLASHFSQKLMGSEVDPLPSPSQWQAHFPNSPIPYLTLLEYKTQGEHATILEGLWLGIPCILKFLKPRDFQLEVFDVLTNSPHPHLIHLTGNFVKDGFQCLVIGRMMGDLRTTLSHRKFSDCPENYLDMIYQVAAVMKHLHAKGIAHGNLSCTNILVLHNGKRLLSGHNDYHVRYGRLNLKLSYSVSMTLLDIDDLPTKLRDGEQNNLFAADVSAFAEVCCEILWTKCEAGPSQMEFQHMAAGLNLPRFPDSCPKSLATYLTTCADFDFQNRPTFDEICSELRKLKGRLMLSIYRIDDAVPTLLK